MEKVYDLHQHPNCVIIQIEKKKISTRIISNSNRYFKLFYLGKAILDDSISYNKQRTDITALGGYPERGGKDDIIIDNFHDGLYNLFKKDRETWDEEDKFLMKAVSDYLPLALKETIKRIELKIESLDLFHYVFVVPSEWEEEIREDILRPIFVQSGLISKEDHQDRLLFFTNIEAICYKLYFERGENTILCRVTPGEEETIIKFDLIQTKTTLFNIPNAKLFPKVISSRSVSVPQGDIEGRIKDFLREKLFPVTKAESGSVRKLLKQFYRDQIIKAIIKKMNKRNKENEPEKKPWIPFKKRWMLSKSQKEFINSLDPSIIYAEIGSFFLGHMKDIVSNNFTKSYRFLLFEDSYSDRVATLENAITWLKNILKYNSRSLNYVVDTEVKVIDREVIMHGIGIGVFEAIQHSDIYCKPRIVSSENLSSSSSVFLNSKPDAIVNLDISLGSTLFSCSNLDKNGLIQQIFDHDYLIGDKHLPPLGYFYTFSNTTTLNVKEQFIPFVERYLQGNLNDLIADNGTSIKQDILLEMEAILTKDRSEGEVLVSIKHQKYITAFMLMYMIYIKEVILDNLPGQLMSDQMDIKIGYDVSIEARLLNNTLESKDNLREIIYTSGLVPKNDHFKKLRITTQGERILPVIQKTLQLELSVKSYFLLCQLHEDYIQLSLHQVVTDPDPEEKDQESIIVQDEIIPIHYIYDSLCSNMWYNLQQDNSLIELCERHNTSNNNEILDLFPSKVKTEFFANFKGHILDNMLQNKPSTQSTDAINLTSSCNCKVHLTTADIIDISFTPVLQDIAYTLSGSLLNKELFGNYINVDYLFSFIRFNNNPQLQSAFTRILEEEANRFNSELGIDTSCTVIPDLFSQLLQPVIAQQPLCYKDFKIGALQQVCSENYMFSLSDGSYGDPSFTYKPKITDTETIECGHKIVFPFLNKGEIRSNRKFYLRNKNDDDFYGLKMEVYKFKTMNYLENSETLLLDDNVYQHVDDSFISFTSNFEKRDVDVPVMVSIKYVPYTSSFQFYVKIVGVGTRDKYLTSVIESGEPLTLARL